MSTDYDLLSANALIDRIGLPAERFPDGTAVITGGRLAIAERVLVDLGDPGAHVVGDVVCDWREISLVQEGPDRVRVSGARGSATVTPTEALEAMAQRFDGETVSVPLSAIAHVCGGAANLGLIARRPEYVSVLHTQVSRARVGAVTRWALPGIDAVNYVPGGSPATLRSLPVQVPVEWG